MFCSECYTVLPWGKVNTTVCNICGVQLEITVEDVLKHGYGDLVKEIRPGQITLGNKVEELLQDKTTKGCIIAEGGTGIGKSFAYIIPILNDYVHRKTQGKQYVIATSNKALQHQLERDIPLLIQKLNIDDRSMVSNKRTPLFSVVKGKSNYACPELIEHVPDMDKGKFKDFTQTLPADVANWKGPRPMWWDDITVENCPHNKKSCPSAKSCSPDYKLLDIMVINQHLLGFMLENPFMLKTGGVDVVVVDEAHQLSESVRGAFSSVFKYAGLSRLFRIEKDYDLIDWWTETAVAHAISTRNNNVSVDEIATIRRLSRAEAQGNMQVISQVRGQTQTIYDCFQDLFGKLASSSRDKRSLVLDTIPPNVIAVCAAALLHLNKTSRLLDEVCRAPSVDDFDYGLDVRARSKAKKALNSLKKLERLFNACVDYSESDRTKEVIAISPEAVEIKAIDISKRFQETLARVTKKAVFVSATLAIGSDFSHFKEELGIGLTKIPEALPLLSASIHASPFNLAAAAQVYLPIDAPVPVRKGQDGYDAWMHWMTEEIKDLVIANKGDAFVLFSNVADMKEIHSRVEPVLFSNRITAVLQDGDANSAIQKFRNNPASVLFGVKSIWEGVDIQGSKLRLVIIPKLPFPPPDDPVIKVLSSIAGNQWFRLVLIPRMLAAVRQGAGRLIRTKTDYGMVAILDSRVWSGVSDPLKHAAVMSKLMLRKPTERTLNTAYGNKLFAALGFKDCIMDKTGAINRLRTYTKRAEQERLTKKE